MRRLTDAERAKVRRLLAAGHTQADVANQVGVSRAAVRHYADAAPPRNPWTPPPPWTEDALCAETDPEVFFPEKGGSNRPAKAICAACPVSVPCLQYALDNDERFGIWGGTSEKDRRHLTHPERPADPGGTSPHQPRRTA